MTRLKVGYQLAVVFSFGSLLFCLVGLLVWWQLAVMQERTAEMVALTVVRAHAQDIRLQEALQQAETLQVVVNGTSKESRAARQDAREAVTEDVSLLLAVAKADPSLFLNNPRPGLRDDNPADPLGAIHTFKHPDPGLLIELEETQEAIDAVDSFFTHELLYAGRHSQAKAVVEFRRSAKSLDSLRSSIGELIAYTTQETAVAQAALQSARRDVFATLIASIWLSVLMFAALAAFMGRRFAARLHRVESSITDIAEKEFHEIEEAFAALLRRDPAFRLNPQVKAIPVTGSDEIAAVETSVNAITKSLAIVQHRHNEMVERATREAKEGEKAAELRQLNAEFGQYVLATTDLARLTQRAVELVAGAMPAPFVRIGEIDAGGTAITFTANAGWPAYLIDDHSLALTESPQAEESVRSGRPVFLECVVESSPLRPSPEALALGIVASATIPIRGTEAVIAVMHVGFCRPHTFSPDDVTFLVSIGSIIGLAIDRDRRERRITVLNSELQLRNQELVTFGYTAAHDLRAPLRAMAGFASALEEDYASTLDAGAQRYIGLIVKGAQQMGGLIEALLALSRVSSQALSCGSVNLTATARSIITELRAHDPGRSTVAIVEEGLTAEGDPALLRNVLANLLANAWKFTRERDPGLIRVEAHALDGETVYAVKDNGIGFSSQHPEEVFAPFKRLHGKSYEGTGIGLATVARIVHRHGGRVWAESEPGSGAAFYFTLGEAA